MSVLLSFSCLPDWVLMLPAVFDVAAWLFISKGKDDPGSQTYAVLWRSRVGAADNLVFGSSFDGVGAVFAKLGGSLVSWNLLDGVVTLVVVLGWLRSQVGHVGLAGVLVLLIFWLSIRLFLLVLRGVILLLLLGWRSVLYLLLVLILGPLRLRWVLGHWSIHVLVIWCPLLITVWSMWGMQVVCLFRAGLQDVEASGNSNTDSSEGPI